MAITKAVVLAAGSGERMAPYHLARPKCLLPLLTEPLLAHLYRALKECGIQEVTLVVKPQDQLQVASVDANGLAVHWVRQLDAMGSGAAAVLADDTVPPDEPMLIVEGDVWASSVDIARVIESVTNGMPMAVLVDPLGREAPQDWIVADVDGGEVRSVWGHPRDGYWRVSGVYALSPLARAALHRPRGWGVQVPVGGMPHREYDVAEVVNTVCRLGASVAAIEAQEPVLNWDKPWHVLQGNWLLLERWAQSHDRWVGEDSTIDPTAVVRGPVRLGANSRIGHGVIIEGPVYVGDNVVIEDYAKVSHAVIGRGSRISHTAEFLGGVIMDRVYLMHNCELYGVLGDNVDIGAGTVSGTLRFDDRGTAHRVGERWETPHQGSNASYLGDYSRTGVNVVILPGKHIGPYAAVGPNIVVDRDIEPYTQVLLEQSWKVTKWGPERYGW
ncbi:MAG: NTP transferase domain-containing protein [Firmicutes bacterium]|nr:NTP transferase domain-containing protein [Bacillota bacterium]